MILEFNRLIPCRRTAVAAREALLRAGVRGERVDHLIFGMVDATVDTTIASGNILMQDKQIQALDLTEIAARTREAAPAMWQRIRDL